ncbi:MAG: PP2C family protein-serine/threonine phosphatase [Phycisphaerales bacterium JB040]
MRAAGLTAAEDVPDEGVFLTRPSTQGLSVRSFVTDGQLAGLCAELSGVYGLSVRLHDERGLVLSVAGGRDEVGREEPIVPGTEWFPILIEGQQIGALTMGPGPEGDDRERLRRILRLLVSTATELCADVVELSSRVQEIRVHYRLSALLAEGGRVEETLQVALDSALEILGLDCGSVVLLPEDADALSVGESERDLEQSVSSGLSERWLRDPQPLSRDRVFDAMALKGEIVTVEDLQQDPDVLAPERCLREGLGSFINAGMVSRGRPIGVIRLYGRRPRRFTRRDRRLIRAIGQQAAAAVQQGRLLALRARERRTQRALQLAGTVQRRMMPRAVPSVGGLDVHGACVPSTELGGDFYDLFELRGGLGVVIGDVVGKGVPAALLMSAVRASFRAHADAVGELGEVMRRVNDGLCRDTTVSEFATLWAGRIDPETLELCSVSAGHEPPVIVRAGEAIELPTGGLVAGVLPDQRYEQTRTGLRPGDTLVAYTDGLMDARNFDGVRWGRDRLLATIVEAVTEASPEDTAEWIRRRIFWSLRQYVGLAGQTDDETMVVVRVPHARG